MVADECQILLTGLKRFEVVVRGAIVEVAVERQHIATHSKVAPIVKPELRHHLRVFRTIRPPLCHRPSHHHHW